MMIRIAAITVTAAGMAWALIGSPLAAAPATPAPPPAPHHPPITPPPTPAAQPAPPARPLAAQKTGPIVALEAFPAAVQLDHAWDLERLVVVATQADGVTLDVSRAATATFQPPGIARLNNRRQLVPAADGRTVLTLAYEGRQITVPVTVWHAQQPPPVSFRHDVEPVLMRAGCNSGACHGSAAGKNGFKMSLFGFSPADDYVRFTRETRARRVSIADPAISLILQKPTLGVAHEGGKRFAVGDEYYNAIARWIAAGAPDDPPTVATITAVEILPHQVVLNGPGATQQLTIRARYSDGSDRDVTRLALLSSNNDNSAVIDPDGVVTAKERGEAFIMARFGTTAVVSQIIVLPANLQFQWPNPPEFNTIDSHVDAKLKKLRITPSGVCDDDTFIRRVFLDVLGVLPRVDEYARFKADRSPNKRNRLIDELLQRPEFPEVWAMKWAEMLRVQGNRLSNQGGSPKALFLYNTWLRDNILKDRPIDAMTRELLGAEGGIFANPAANFYTGENDPKVLAENVAQVFLGMRIQCAACHNHPFERWTMDDYYSFAAFFAQIGRKTGEDPRETIIFNSGGGEVGHILGGRPMPPKFLGGEAPQIKPGEDRRKVLADWITSPRNPWFATTFANRVWTHFMGKGIIDPPDDARVSNPPSNPELLEALGKKLRDSRYDLRGLVREICNSRTYQLDSRPNPSNQGDDRNFAHARVRRLTAEQMLDAICQVTETPEKFAGLPLGSRAVQIADGPTGNYFLTVFGRPKRETVSTEERRGEPTLSQALHLINGETVAARISNPNGRLARLRKAKTPVDRIIEDIYVAAFSRPPQADEMAGVKAYLAQVKDEQKGLEDLYWAVLNSKEFIFNH